MKNNSLFFSEIKYLITNKLNLTVGILIMIGLIMCVWVINLRKEIRNLNNAEFTAVNKSFQPEERKLDLHFNITTSVKK